MKSSYEKKWSEGFAKELLESIFPDTYKNIILKDKPDLQMESHGIEVTRVFYTNQSEVIHLYDFIIKKGKSRMFPKTCDRAMWNFRDPWLKNYDHSIRLPEGLQQDKRSFS